MAYLIDVVASVPLVVCRRQASQFLDCCFETVYPSIFQKYVYMHFIGSHVLPVVNVH